jgi:4-hydroxythreonine-4-phosphate dehydrogenase
MSCRRLAITPGEPAGIGPDLVLQIAQQDWPHQLVVIADPALLRERAALLGCPSSCSPMMRPPPPQRRAPSPSVPFRSAPVPGEARRGNGAYVLATLQRACDGNLSGELPPW